MIIESQKSESEKSCFVFEIPDKKTEKKHVERSAFSLLEPNQFTIITLITSLPILQTSYFEPFNSIETLF